MNAVTPNVARFGTFELDLQAHVLRKNGLKIGLPEQSIQILAMLVTRSGEVVEREAIRKRLWPNDTFVAFEHSINAAINRLRGALGDEARMPRHIETLPKRGYRFLVPVECGWRTRPIDSVAILPFENVGCDPEKEYLSQGITEAIINNLSQLPQLRVVPRNSAFRYKGRDVDPAIIRQELGVRAMVTGRVMQHGEKLVVCAELVDLASESQLWGERFNRSFSDIFAVQEEMATRISEELRPKLTDEDRGLLARRQTQSREAYEFYLKGRYYWSKRTPDSLKRATEYYEQAVREDPLYALAYAGLSEGYILMGWWGLSTSNQAIERATAAAFKSVELDPQLAEGHTSLGYVRCCARDWSGAEDTFRRALKLNPGYWLAHCWYGQCLSAMGRAEEAVNSLHRAREIDPLALVVHHFAAWANFHARRFDEVIELCSKALDMEPNYGVCLLWLGVACTEKGMHKEALTALRRAMEMLQGPVSVAMLGHACVRAGLREEAESCFEQLVRASQAFCVDPYHVATVAAGLKKFDEAFEYLETAFAERSLFLTFWAKADPRLDSLRTDPRFDDLLRKLKLDIPTKK